MAEITTPTSKGNGKVRSHKLSTHIDMTPMVDLGFLLITFFMLTTILTQPVVMQLAMPDIGPPVPTTTSGSLTILLDKDNSIYYYQGIAGEAGVKTNKTTFAADGIRKLLFDYRQRIGNQFTIVIKANDTAKYRNMIDLLDELHITNCKRYAIVAITEADKKLIPNV